MKQSGLIRLVSRHARARLATRVAALVLAALQLFAAGEPRQWRAPCLVAESARTAAPSNEYRVTSQGVSLKTHCSVLGAQSFFASQALAEAAFADRRSLVGDVRCRVVETSPVESHEPSDASQNATVRKTPLLEPINNRIVIERARADDADAIVDMHWRIFMPTLDIFDPAADREIPTRILRHNLASPMTVALVARQGDRVVGYTIGYLIGANYESAEGAHGEETAVEPAYSDRGVGRALFAARSDALEKAPRMRTIASKDQSKGQHAGRWAKSLGYEWRPDTREWVKTLEGNGNAIQRALPPGTDDRTIKFIRSRFGDQWEEAIDLMGPQVADSSRWDFIDVALRSDSGLPVDSSRIPILSDLLHYRDVQGHRFEDYPGWFRSLVLHASGPYGIDRSLVNPLWGLCWNILQPADAQSGWLRDAAEVQAGRPEFERLLDRAGRLKDRLHRTPTGEELARLVIRRAPNQRAAYLFQASFMEPVGHQNFPGIAAALDSKARLEITGGQHHGSLHVLHLWLIDPELVERVRPFLRPGWIQRMGDRVLLGSVLYRQDSRNGTIIVEELQAWLRYVSGLEGVREQIGPIEPLLERAICLYTEPQGYVRISVPAVESFFNPFEPLFQIHWETLMRMDRMYRAAQYHPVYEYNRYSLAKMLDHTKASAGAPNEKLTSIGLAPHADSGRSMLRFTVQPPINQPVTNPLNWRELITYVARRFSANSAVQQSADSIMESGQALPVEDVHFFFNRWPYGVGLLGELGDLVTSDREAQAVTERNGRSRAPHAWRSFPNLLENIRLRLGEDTWLFHTLPRIPGTDVLMLSRYKRIHTPMQSVIDALARGVEFAAERSPWLHQLVTASITAIVLRSLPKRTITQASPQWPGLQYLRVPLSIATPMLAADLAEEILHHVLNHVEKSWTEGFIADPEFYFNREDWAYGNRHFPADYFEELYIGFVILNELRKWGSFGRLSALDTWAVKEEYDYYLRRAKRMLKSLEGIQGKSTIGGDVLAPLGEQTVFEYRRAWLDFQSHRRVSGSA